jgi:hypothetical protein
MKLLYAKHVEGTSIESQVLQIDEGVFYADKGVTKLFVPIAAPFARNVLTNAPSCGEPDRSTCRNVLGGIIHDYYRRGGNQGMTGVIDPTRIEPILWIGIGTDQLWKLDNGFAEMLTPAARPQ